MLVQMALSSYSYAHGVQTKNPTLGLNSVTRLQDKNTLAVKKRFSADTIP